MKLITILYVSIPCGRSEAVESILKAQKIEYRVYGGRPWRGFGDKLKMVHEAANTLTEYTHVLVLDGFDCICMAGEQALLDRFLEFNHPWVMTAEINCWPEAARFKDYPNPPETPWRYVNTGPYMAERTYMAACMNRWGGATLDPAENDQRWFTDRYLAEPGAILLDTGCRLFQSLLGGFDMLQYEPHKLTNLKMGTEPLVLHHNGGGDIRDEKTRGLWV